MRKLLPLLVLLALVGIAVLILAKRGPSGLPTGEHPLVEATQPTHVEEREFDRGTTATLVASAREALAPAEPAADPATFAAPDPPPAHLTVHVIGKSSQRPIASMSVSIQADRDLVAGLGVTRPGAFRGDLGTQRTTGSDGVAEFDVPSGQKLSVWANGTRVETGDVNVRVPELRPDERRGIVVEVPDVRDAPLFGKVVSADGSAPIGGARVQCMKPGAPGKETRTDEQGLFEFRFPSWEPPQLRVDADGYGVLFASVRRDYPDREHALVLRLSRSSTLHAHVLAVSGAPIADARIELTARGTELRYDEVTDSGLTSRDLNEVPDEHWKAETAPDGFATIAGLSPGIDLSWTVTDEAGRVLRREPTGLRLQPGEVRELEVPVGAGTRIHGHVLDQKGQPVAEAELWLVKADKPERRRIYTFEGRSAAAKVQCDADGAYVFADVSEGTWRIGPAEYYPSERSAGPDSIAGVAELVQLAGEADLTLDIRVSRGLLIRGRVVAPDGTPVPRAQVSAHCEASGNLASAETDPDGEFVIGPLELEPYSLKATDRTHFAPSDEVQAQAGEEHLVLKLKASGKLRGKVVDQTSGAGCSAHVVVMTNAPGDARVGGVALVKDDGEFEVEGVGLGSCTVTASTTDGRFAQVQAEVFADRVSVAPPLALAHGGTLRMRYTGEGSLSFFAVSWNGAIVLFGQELEAGTTKEMPAPAGKLTLRTRKSGSNSMHDLPIELARGETKDVVVTDKD